ncbi:hypothetical protein D3C73_804830 [compost metagenome]
MSGPGCFGASRTAACGSIGSDWLLFQQKKDNAAQNKSAYSSRQYRFDNTECNVRTRTVRGGYDIHNEQQAKQDGCNEKRL